MYEPGKLPDLTPRCRGCSLKTQGMRKCARCRQDWNQMLCLQCRSYPLQMSSSIYVMLTQLNSASAVPPLLLLPRQREQRCK